MNREESEKRRGELSSLALRFALDSPSDWRISSQVGRNRGNGMKKGKRDREKAADPIGFDGRLSRIRRPIESEYTNETSRLYCSIGSLGHHH